ncbi:acyltransferase [Colwellia sp. MB02u-14]|uniref:acyltransferase n=1 Tax=Colwellia sp. MB02u-14 TaxID=2759815 RepID=UPI0015F70E13|nr:acyltransferase [Colwellia sp. MB02u-14]MBA6301927.1 acyltransferase [Colwellia sp. MB02u-14]
MLRKLITQIIIKPISFTKKLWLEIFIWRLSTKHNIDIQGQLNLNGIPMIDIWEKCQLIIDDGVVLNSRNKGYHINMHSPVKLLADSAGAVIKIGSNTRIHGTCIHANQSIKIGKNCLIAANCHIFDNNGHDISFPLVANRVNTKGKSIPVEIKDNVWIGANSIILPGVTIGEGSVISANSVVNIDIPAMVVAGGNPAIIIKKQNKNE